MIQTHPRWHRDRTPDKPALIIADRGDSISYTQLLDRADRAAQLLQSLGVRQGDTIAILMENQIRYAELCWAAKNSGITYTCISSQSSVDDALYIVQNSDARLLISSMAIAEVAVQVAERIGDALGYLMIDGVAGPFRSYEALLGEQPATPMTGRRRGPSMLYSSGTTGRPKGVRTPLPEDPPEVPPRRFAMLQRRYGLDADTVLLAPGPLYHAAPGRFMVSVQRVGGTAITLRKFDAEAVLEAIERYRVTHGLFVPTMFVRLLQLPADVRRRYDLSSLRCAIHLAAPCPVHVKEQMIEWLGPVVEELYSGTESVGHTMISSQEWLLHKGSVGRAADNCEMRVVDEQGRAQPPLHEGVIMMRNGNRFEYHKDPGKTQAAYDAEGWASLGDIGYLDADGYLYLTDRQSHMIISGGVNIYPQETENLLLTHPAIADVAVIGVPNADFGEEVKAVVQLHAPADNPRSLAAELIAYCKARLSPIKCPRSVDFVDELPRSEAGKLLKRVVREPYWRGHEKSII